MDPLGSVDSADRHSAGTIDRTYSEGSGVEEGDAVVSMTEDDGQPV